MIHIITGILPHESVGGLTIQTALVERTTYGNIGSNGDTVHHHVLMKMFPDAYGEAASFSNSIPYSQSFSYDLGQTNVEELDDLMLAVFIQDDSTREVIQSAYAYGDTSLSSNTYLQAITIDGAEMDGFEPHVEEYFLELPPGTIESPVMEGIPMNENALLSTVQAFILPGFSSVDVYSEDRTEWKRYSVYISFTTTITELDDNESLVVNLYPNPFTSTTTLTYTLTEPSTVTISIFNPQGQLIEKIEKEQTKGEQQVQWNAEGLPAGMYYFRIQAGEQYGSGKLILFR